MLSKIVEKRFVTICFGLNRKLTGLEAPNTCINGICALINVCKQTNIIPLLN